MARVERVYTGEIHRPKKSILRRWSIANALFFSIIFAVFSVSTYFITTRALIGGQRSAITSIMAQLEGQLSQSDQPLTTGNLRTVLEYRGSTSDGIIETSDLVSKLISSRSQLFVYNTQRQMIFSTNGHSQLTIENTYGHTDIIDIPGYKGYLMSQPIVSKHTGKVIAYAQIFYNLQPYYQARNVLILSLIGMAAFAVAAAAIFAYLMARRNLQPIQKITDSMSKVATNPEEVFEPVEIKRDDEVRQIAEFYNDMMARVAMILDRQKRFVSDVAHELRTPLAVIDGNLNMLLRWGKEDPEVLAETLEISKVEASRMTEMITDMLELSRLESLPEENHEATTDVSKACADSVRNFQLIHSDFEIIFDNQLVVETAAKIAEKHYLQALTILLDNAIKYTGEGDKRIELTLLADSDFILTSVSDHGVGISSEDAEKVFERFFRADKSRNRDVAGTGLGLAIISQILKFYQGEILLDSEVGKGSTFTIKIPKA